MAGGNDEDVNSPTPDPRRPFPPFVEVMCKSSCKIRRFASGTDAGFALMLINKKLDSEKPSAWLIEAVKEGEEPVSFGTKAKLADYGDGWKLQTVTEFRDQCAESEDGRRRKRMGIPPDMTPDNSRRPAKADQPAVQPSWVQLITQPHVQKPKRTKVAAVKKFPKHPTCASQSVGQATTQVPQSAVSIQLNLNVNSDGAHCVSSNRSDTPRRGQAF